MSETNLPTKSTPSGGLDSLQTRIVRRKLATLKPLEKNARYMTAAQFDRLVENLKRGGVLTSLPPLPGELLLSGNHPVRPAMRAGVPAAAVGAVITPPDHETPAAIPP